MSRAELLEKIRETIYECFPDLEGTELKEDTVINTDANVDSMGFTLVLCRLEAALGVQIPTRRWNRLRTLGDVADAIGRELQKRGR